MSGDISRLYLVHQSKEARSTRICITITLDLSLTTLSLLSRYFHLSLPALYQTPLVHNSMSLSILVVGATGKQGGGAIDAILDAPSSSDKFKVFGLTRNTTSTKSVALADRGVTLLKADLKDYDSIVAALKESKAKKCVLVTDYFSAGSAAKETQQGINFLKAVEEVDPSIFVVRKYYYS
jgi:hypothetical protein